MSVESKREFETIWAFGPQCGNNSMESIIAANMLCNSFGLDTISTGNLIGSAMEYCECEILTEKDVSGLNLTFGNHKALIDIITKIAYRASVSCSSSVQRLCPLFKVL